MTTLRQLPAKIARLVEERERLARRDLLQAAETARQAAQEAAPVDTGELRDSIRVTEIADGAFVVEPDTDYAAIQEARTGFMDAGDEAGKNELRRKGYRQ